MMVIQPLHKSNKEVEYARVLLIGSQTDLTDGLTRLDEIMFVCIAGIHAIIDNLRIVPTFRENDTHNQ